MRRVFPPLPSVPFSPPEHDCPRAALLCRTVLSREPCGVFPVLVPTSGWRAELASAPATLANVLGRVQLLTYLESTISGGGQVLFQCPAVGVRHSSGSGRCAGRYGTGLCSSVARLSGRGAWHVAHCCSTDSLGLSREGVGFPGRQNALQCPGFHR